MTPVFVIGGGFAGLAAATALAEAGVTVHVLEGRPGLGGRATAFRDPVTGERIDNGQHVLAGCYTETLTFLRRIGRAAHLHRPSALRVPMIDENGRRSVLALPPLPAPLHLLAGVLAWDALSFGERLSVLRIAGPLRRVAGLKSRATNNPDRDATNNPDRDVAQDLSPAITDSDETVRQWLGRHGQSPRLCRMLWEPLALAALNQTVDDAAAHSFIAVIGRMFGADPDAATLLLPAVPLDDLYALPASGFLRSAGSIVSTSSSAHIVVSDGRISGVRVRDGMMPATIVVSAVPWFAFAGLFDTPPAELEPILTRASTLGSSPIVTVNLWLDRAVLDEPFVGLPGRTFQWVFDRRSLVGSSQSHLSLVSSGAKKISAAPNEELMAIATRELRTALPARADLSVRHAAVVRERRATFSLAPGSPRRPGTHTAVEGLLLAGDWIDTGLPGTIESAVLSGHRAARAALALLSH